MKPRVSVGRVLTRQTVGRDLSRQSAFVEPLLVLGLMSIVALLILISVDGMLTDLMSGPPRPNSSYLASP